MSAFTIETSHEENRIQLHSVLDLSSAEDLLHGFRNCLETGNALVVSGTEVERLTTPCIQILCALQRKAALLNVPFTFSEMSDACRQALTDVGIPQDSLILEHTI